MTLEESVQHVVMKAIQEVGGGAGVARSLRGGNISRTEVTGIGSIWLRAGFCQELSWPDYPVSCVC